MMDSCRPSKLEAGFEATNSISRSLKVCTIRSDPGRFAARSGTEGGRTFPTSRCSCSVDGAGISVLCWLFFCFAVIDLEANRVEALALAPIKPRRVSLFFLTDFFDFPIQCHPIVIQLFLLWSFLHNINLYHI